MDINDRLSVSIGELARFTRKNGNKAGNVKWSSGASIGFNFDTENGLLVLEYTYQKTQAVEERIRLVRTATNLKKGLQHYALCPITGKQCRKLYLYGGRFISRYAIPENYTSNNRSKKQRDFEKAFSFILLSEKSKYRKEYYKGKLTPFGKKCQKKIFDYMQVNPQFSNLL